MPIPNLLCIHHVNFFVRDAAQWRRWFEYYLDFQAIARTSKNYTHTEILQHGKVQIRISEAVNRHSPVAKYLENHPQGIGEIGFTVRDPAPEILPAIVPGWGDVMHTFVPKLDPESDLARDRVSGCLFSAIDHMVVNVSDMDATAAWYEQNLGLHQGDRFTIQTENSALRSIVMKSPDLKSSVQLSEQPWELIQIPINEPSTSNSQIQEFLNYNGGAGIQHLALLTDDIISTVTKLKHRGLDFLETFPPILVEPQDLASGQTLMQIFTKPIFNEPTFFFEIIQRQNRARGFGRGNFQALFEAVERQQLELVNMS